jgi:hypothetical protein
MEQWVYCDTKEFIDHQWSYSCIALVKLSYETTEAMESWEKKEKYLSKSWCSLKTQKLQKESASKPKILLHLACPFTVKS